MSIIYRYMPWLALSVWKIQVFSGKFLLLNFENEQVRELLHKASPEDRI